MKFRTVTIESPSRCTYESGYMVVRKCDQQAKIHLSEIRNVFIETQQAFVSSYLLGRLAEEKIPVVISDGKHNPVGEYLPLCGAHNMSGRIRKQLNWGKVPKNQVWKFIVQEKIRQQAAVLDFMECSAAESVLLGYVNEVRSGDATNREACAAKLYFETLFGVSFNRKLNIPINAALNYGYSIILSMVNREIVSKGYLMQLGIHHRSEFNHYNLACDLMEPFRPLVDGIVLMLPYENFTSEHKHILQDIANHEIFYDGGRYTVQSVINSFLTDCFNVLNQETEAETLKGFDALWPYEKDELDI